MPKNNKSNLKRIIESGRDLKCECCGLVNWNGLPITLQVHHKDGNKDNNELNNLQLLCPNCHSQTDNWCAKNRNNKLKEIYYCKNCGKQLSEKCKTGLCSECNRDYERSLSKNPGKEILMEDCRALKSYSAIARKYGVCSRTAKKWCSGFGFLKEDII